MEDVLSALHGLEDVGLVAPVEGGRSGQEHVGDDADGPQIALLIVGAPEDLRGDVVGGTDGNMQLLIRLEVPGEAEVDEFEVAVFALVLEKEVLQLEVAVGEVVGVP